MNKTECVIQPSANQKTRNTNDIIRKSQNTQKPMVFLHFPVFRSVFSCISAFSNVW